MQSQVFPGGLYVDALPSGEWCVLFRGRGIQTHLGLIPLPGDDVLFLRCTNINGFKFAGQAQSTLDPACWEFVNGAWTAYPPPCVGNSPVIYDTSGVLHRSDGSIGSQGWRYVAPDGTLVTGDHTYGPLHGINEYTVVDDLLIGQGNGDNEGVVVWDGRVRRQLTAGNTRFIRVQSAGEQVAISFVRPDRAEIITTTLSEVRVLPILPVAVPPSPPPPVDPPKEPVMQLPAQVAAIITRYTTAIPVPQGAGPGTADWDATTNGASSVFEDKCRMWVRGLGEQACFETGDARWGVKNAGGGRPQSKDSITFNGDHLYNFDVLSGVGTGQPRLSVPTTAEVIDGQQFMPVSPVDHLHVATPPVTSPPPVTPPVTPPANPNDAELAARVGALEAALAHILASQETLEGRISALPTPAPAPDLTPYAKKGDPVTVSAKLPFLGSVVAHGTIDR